MKLKEKILFNKNEENIVILAALGIIALNAMPAINYTASIQGEIENPDNAVQSEGAKGYIRQFGQILSANDYGAIKTLYKLQSTLDDIAGFSLAEDAGAINSSGGLSDILSQVTPYMSKTKQTKISGIMGNVDKTRKTYESLVSIRSKLSELPEGISRGEKLKTIFNEIPNLTSLPILNSLNGIKGVMSLLKTDAQRTVNEIEGNNTPTTELSEQSEFDEIYELMEMFEKKR